MSPFMLQAYVHPHTNMCDVYTHLNAHLHTRTHLSHTPCTHTSTHTHLELVELEVELHQRLAHQRAQVRQVPEPLVLAVDVERVRLLHVAHHLTLQ